MKLIKFWFIFVFFLLMSKHNNNDTIHFSESNQSEASMKKSMNSLLYVRKLCITTIRNLKSGSANPGEIITMVNILCLTFWLSKLLKWYLLFS